MHLSLVCCILLASAFQALGFVPRSRPLLTNPASSRFEQKYYVEHRFVTAPKSTALAANFKNKVDESNPVEITFPTPDDAAAMGIRDWPQKFHSSTWSESVSEGQIATRYVLDGKGRVNVEYLDSYTGNVASRKERVYPGTLVEVEGEATLVWDVDDEKTGMIVLTPNFEEGGKLILVAGFLVVLVAGLVAGLGG